MKITDILNEGLDQPTRRGFLKGLASFAASAAVPTSVVKMLSTPAGVASLPVAAGIALLKGIRDHLAQWDEESGSEAFDAHESMVELLGFEERTATKNDVDNDPRNRVGDDLSAEDQMYDLLYLYRTNPELAAAQLIKHLQSASIDPADVKSSFVSRDDIPSDSRSRYQNKLNRVDDRDTPDSDETSLSTMTRLAGLAKGANTSINPAPAVKDMGPIQYANNMPALPAPTKPEFDLAPDLKQKEKVPVSRNDDTMSEKLGDNRPALGSKRDQGKSVRQWRKQRGLDESAN